MKSLSTTIFLLFSIATFAQHLEVDGDVDVKNNNIINLANPANPQDAATKAYVDLLEKRIADLEFVMAYTAGDSMITDIDGNDYKVVKIGSQYWTANNLKTTRYNDGTAISLVVDSFGVDGWTTLSAPAYCWPFNDSDSLAFIYGALYNYFAVSDSNGHNVCPVGWHVPTEQEWNALEEFLVNNEFGYEGSGNIGKAMASKNLWGYDPFLGNVGSDPNSNNTSGFDGRPAGQRLSVDGQFRYTGFGGYWWTSSSSTDTHAYVRDLISWSPDLNQSFRNKKNGFSVRCVKD